MIRSFYDKISSPDAYLALISGILLTLSFPRFSLSGLAFVALIPILYAVTRCDRKNSSFFSGFIAGLVFYLGTIYWLTVTMERYGDLPRVFSLMILLLLSSYLALYFGIFAWGVGRMERQRIPLLIGAPPLWVALEYARGHLLTGFPWALLGYSQYKNLLLIQVSDVTGVYGVGFLVVLINVVFYEVLRSLKRRERFRHLVVSLGGVILLLLFVAAYGAIRLRSCRNSVPEATIRVGIVQGNIEQKEKWDPAFREKILSILTRLSRRTLAEKPDLIIWPEAAVPFFFTADRENQSRLLALIDDLGVDLLFGSPDLRIRKGKEEYFNSVFLVSPGARLRGKYDKLHLVPFGEYVPLRRALFFVHPLIDQIGDMTPGRRITLMETDKGKCGTPICYEIILPDLVRRFVKEGADFIATLTNDDWFGRSSAPYQHFSMAVFRAVENRVPLVRAANSGISGAVMPDGRIAHATKIFMEDAFTVDLPLRQHSRTLYTRFGDVFAWLCIVCAVLLLARTFLPMKRS
ncbi:MAG: apolipoprotein N-acyltransferase [Deltaproteobacteria bacterium]|nr:apolipoprotein N-acyltransferase [Deltaproteobacteria bacterium]